MSTAQVGRLWRELVSGDNEITSLARRKRIADLRRNMTSHPSASTAPPRATLPFLPLIPDVEPINVPAIYTFKQSDKSWLKCF